MSRAHCFAKFFECKKTLTKKPDTKKLDVSAAVNGFHALVQVAQATQATKQAAQAALAAFEPQPEPEPESEVKDKVKPEPEAEVGSTVVWRPAQVYAGTELFKFSKYLVSNTGQVRHKNKDENRVRKLFMRYGSKCVALRRDGAVSNLDQRVHLLVASTFKSEERTATKTYCIHVDGDTLNNTVANLKWVNKEEAAAAWGTRRRRKKRTSCAKPVFRRKRRGPVEMFRDNTAAAKRLARETGDSVQICSARVSRYATMGCTVDGDVWSFIDPTTLPEEKWKRVASCYAKPGVYLVSSYGRVFQRYSKEFTRPVDLIQRPNKTVVVRLQASTKMAAPTKYVEHEVGKLVYTAFKNDHAPLPDGFVVNYLDKNRLNNSVGNVSIKKPHGAKKVECTWADGRRCMFPSATAAAKTLHITTATVYSHVRTATATRKGIKFKYKFDSSA